MCFVCTVILMTGILIDGDGIANERTKKYAQK